MIETLNESVLEPLIQAHTLYNVEPSPSTSALVLKFTGSVKRRHLIKPFPALILSCRRELEKIMDKARSRQSDSWVKKFFTREDIANMVKEMKVSIDSAMQSFIVGVTTSFLLSIDLILTFLCSAQDYTRKP